jgi:hypothetical protein
MNDFKKGYVLIVFIILTFLVTSVLTEGKAIEETPLTSGTEYIVKVDGDKTELDWIIHLTNKGNQTLYGFGVSFDFSINTNFENRTLDCGNKILTDSNGKLEEFQICKNDSGSFVHYTGVGGELKPDNSFSIVSTFNCKGFATKKEGYDEVNWIFTKIPKTEEMVIRYEISKPLFKDVEIVERFPPASQVYSDSNKVSVEWVTSETNLSPSFGYRYKWDMNSIIIMIVSIILGAFFDEVIRFVSNKRNFINNLFNYFRTKNKSSNKK